MRISTDLLGFGRICKDLQGCVNLQMRAMYVHGQELAWICQDCARICPDLQGFVRIFSRFRMICEDFQTSLKTCTDM